MFKVSSSLTVFMIAICLILQPKPIANENPLQTSEEPLSTQDMNELEKLSYSVGTILGKRLQKDQIELDKKTFVKGLTDAFFDRQYLLSDQEIATIMHQYNEQRMANRAKQTRSYLEKRKRAEQRYLKTQSQRANVNVLPSGLIYEVIRSSDNPMTALSDQMITFHFRSYDSKGKEIENSLNHSHGISAPLKDLIPGWQIAFQKMKVGDIWKVIIPSSLAYGPKGTKEIAPYSSLMFELELLGISKEEQN